MTSTPLLTMGVIGGMGPDATVDFLARMVKQTPAKKDQDHIPMIIDHRPQVPNRHTSIEGSGESAAPYLTEMARNLASSGADFIVMPCNTAHAYAQNIAEAVNIPFVNLIEETVAQIQGVNPAIQSIGVMAAAGCLDAGLYQNALKKRGYTPVLWNSNDAAKFMALVYRIKAGDKGPEVQEGMLSLAQQLLADGAELIIAACTEIPLVLSASELAEPLLDSTDVLVAQAIAYSLGKIPLPVFKRHSREGENL